MRARMPRGKTTSGNLVASAKLLPGATSFRLCRMGVLAILPEHTPRQHGWAFQVLPRSCGGASQHTQVSSAIDEPRARSPPQEDNYPITTIISVEAACNKGPAHGPAVARALSRLYAREVELF